MKFLSETDQRRLTCALQNMRMSCNSTYLLDPETDAVDPTLPPEVRKMAALSSAKFYRATNRRELQLIYDEIDQLEKTEVKLRRFTTYRPLFQWPLLAAFGLLAIELLLANKAWVKDKLDVQAMREIIAREKKP